MSQQTTYEAAVLASGDEEQPITLMWGEDPELATQRWCQALNMADEDCTALVGVVTEATVAEWCVQCQLPAASQRRHALTPCAPVALVCAPSGVYAAVATRCFTVCTGTRPCPARMSGWRRRCTKASLAGTTLTSGEPCAGAVLIWRSRGP